MMDELEIKKEEETDSDFDPKEEETEMLLEETKEEIPETLFDCSRCQRTFSSLKSLRIHLKKSHGGKKKKTHSCSECKKEFKTSFHLKRHQRIHSGEKPFKCNQCKMRFSTSDHLQKHEMRMHIGEK